MDSGILQVQIPRVKEEELMDVDVEAMLFIWAEIDNNIMHS